MLLVMPLRTRICREELHAQTFLANNKLLAEPNDDVVHLSTSGHSCLQILRRAPLVRALLLHTKVGARLFRGLRIRIDS